MLILSIRTDKPEAELGLYEDAQQLASLQWQAHRELAATLHSKIEELLSQTGKDWPDIAGLVCFLGPGSFTGLRIGLSVANTLASTLGLPIVGGTGEDWADKGVKELVAGKNHKIVIPDYGRPARTTQPKK